MGAGIAGAMLRAGQGGTLTKKGEKIVAVRFDIIIESLKKCREPNTIMRL